ncbi:MAG: cellulase family glycosylhydrolase [Actinobacteria bacterium]|nr:cellulase family glycosylhydrolase [Actinomycetota bacterium]
MVATLVLAPASASARPPLPPGFIGISPQSPVSAREFSLMAEAGISSVRLPLFWNAVEPKSPSYAKPNWSNLDDEVSLAAEAGIRVMVVVTASPPWVAPETIDLPVRTGFQRQAWARFLREAAQRYGPLGSFWSEHTKLPFLPIRTWEIWNEENLVTWAREPNPTEYATLLRIAGRTLHRVDSGSQVLIGGFFGQPLQIPPNVGSDTFLRGIYRAGNVKPYFDGVALHPYVANADGMGHQLTVLRRIMNAHGDRATPLYVTELGWGSAAGPTRWEVGVQGQANELNRSFALLSANRVRWNVRGAWWFSWSDEGGTCLFCGSAGLLTTKREAKPSWYRFNEWTGGDAAIVPRARLSTLQAEEEERSSAKSSSTKKRAAGSSRSPKTRSATARTAAALVNRSSPASSRTSSSSSPTR